MRAIKTKSMGLFFIVFLFLMFSSCGKSSPSPEEARIKLGQMGIKYNMDSLIEQINNNDILAVKLFIDAGMNIKARDRQNRSLLEIIAENGNVDIMRLFLEKGAAESWENVIKSLEIAAKKGDLGIVKILFDKHSSELKDFNYARIGWTFYFAAQNGHPEIVKYFLDKGVPVNLIIDNKSLTVLVGSATNIIGTAVIELLVERGANINAEDKNGETALVKIAAMGTNDILEYLISKGAAINHKSKKGYSALMAAAIKGHYDTVKILVEKDADINAVDNNGHTALYFAKIKGYSNIVQILNKAGVQ